MEGASGRSEGSEGSESSGAARARAGRQGPATCNVQMTSTAIRREVQVVLLRYPYSKGTS